VGLITTDPQGSYHYLLFTAKRDGKDYPAYTEALLADMVEALLADMVEAGN